jgi:uncharacterized protein (DUF2252 family)
MAEGKRRDRSERGRERRRETPRSAHATWEPAPTRDPLAILEAQAVTRVAALVPIRHGRMSASPFAFYRGAAAIMAADLATTPRTGIRTQLCGDAHLVNFGGYGTPERNLVFDVNDFDETLPGSFEWDVKRLAASFVVAGRGNGFSREVNRRAVLSLVGTYRNTMRDFGDRPYLATWYARLTSSTIRKALPSKRRGTLDKGVRRVTTEDPLRPIGKLTAGTGGDLRIRSHPPLLYRLGDLPGVDGKELRDTVEAAIRAYRKTLPLDRHRLLDHYRVVDVAHKVVGIGSVGLRAFIVLMRGRSDEDLLILQVKEAKKSVLEAHLGRSEFRWPGERVVQGQRLMQAASDIFLGWLGVPGQPAYYVRQLRDWKAGVDVAGLDAAGLEIYARACGWTLARAHARSGEPAEISGYLGSSDRFDGAIADFSETYANQNESDYRAFLKQVKNGRIASTTGV